MNNKIKFQFLGGVEEVGRLSMVLDTEDLRLLFEYGMAPEKPPKYPMKPPAVDMVLLTHSHLDHSGMIPWLFSAMDQKILTTKVTRDITDILYKDSINIAKSEGYAVPYSRSSIREAKHSVEPVSPGLKRPLGEKYNLKCHSAGHIPGSLMFELIGDKKILFSGDFNVIDTKMVKKAKPVDCDILFLEGTYAGRDHPKKRSEIEKDLILKIDEVVSRGGTAVLPAFAVSRSQELLMVLRKTGFNIWFDGMGRKVAKLFLKHPNYLRSSKELKKAVNNVSFVHSNHGRKIALKKADVIVTSSGMMDGGPVLSYMNKLKDSRKNAVLLTGYQVPDSNARLLMDKGKLDFYGVLENVECMVDYFDFSAHAGHSELVDFAKKCEPEKIVLMHSDNREALVPPLKDIADVYTPKTGEVVEL